MSASDAEPIVAQKIVDAEKKGKDNGASTDVEAAKVKGEGEKEEVDETAGRRVHIGNLPFTAKEEEVKAFVSSVGGTVESFELVTRQNGRPAGFGFAVWATAEEARAAVNKLNKQSFSDRELYVVLARPANEKREPRERKPRTRKTTGASTATAVGGGGETTDAEKEKVEGVSGGEGGKKKKSQRKKRPARRLPEASEDAPASTLEEPVTTTAEPPLNDLDEPEQQQQKPKKKRNNKSRSAKNKDAAAAGGEEGKAREARIDVGGEETAVEGEVKEKSEKTREKRERKPREPRTVPTGDPSSTLLFVANLPYNVDDKGLSEMFTNLNISIKSAKVITKRAIVRTRKGSSTEKQQAAGASDAEGGQNANENNDSSKGTPAPRRSKGFGFVDTINEEEQQKAMKALEGFKIGEREITVRVANDRKPIEEQAEEVAQKGEQAVAA